MTTLNATQPAEAAAQTERVMTRSGFAITIEKNFDAGQIEVKLRARTTKKCVFHWGVHGLREAAWHSLPQAQWPENTRAAGNSAMKTDFKQDNGEGRISIRMSSGDNSEVIEFALLFPEEGRWDN